MKISNIILNKFNNQKKHFTFKSIQDTFVKERENCKLEEKASEKKLTAEQRTINEIIKYCMREYSTISEFADKFQQAYKEYLEQQPQKAVSDEDNSFSNSPLGESFSIISRAIVKYKKQEERYMPYFDVGLQAQLKSHITKLYDEGTIDKTQINPDFFKTPNNKDETEEDF